MASEYFAARHRGTAVGLINVTAAGLGNMLAPAFGIAVYAVSDGPERWRWVFGLIFLPAILVLYFRRYVPDTPRYLAASGQIHAANVVITKLAVGDLRREPAHVEEYLVEPGTSADVKPPSGSWLDVVRGKYLSRTVLLTLAVACSYAAQISMLTLMPTILVQSGYAVNRSLWFTLLM